MAFDSYDLVLPPNHGDILCIPCAREAMADHPDWSDPEDEDGNMRPIFNLDEVPRLETCGSCGYISEYGSFGPEAVDYGLELVEQALAEGRRTEYLDVYAARLRSCCLGDAEQTAAAELVLDRYDDPTPFRVYRLDDDGEIVEVRKFDSRTAAYEFFATCDKDSWIGVFRPMTEEVTS